MKKRFTVMLDQEVINKIKSLYNYWTPTAVRESIETKLKVWVEYQLDNLSGKYNDLQESRYQFDDK